MNIVCVQDQLKSALDIVKRGAASKSTLAVLGCVLLEASDGLKLSTTNLESFVVKKIGAKVEKEGSVLVPVDVLSEFVSSLPNGPVTIKQTKAGISVSCGTMKANIRSMPVDEFPTIPSVEASLEIDGEVLKTAINRVAYAAAKDDTRPTLSGMYFHGGEKLSVVTADGFRLAKVTVPVAIDIDVLVPARVAREIGRTVSGTVTIGYNQNHIEFAFDGCKFGSRLIEGKFPDYNRVIPEGGETNVVLNSADLARAVKTATVFSDTTVALGFEDSIVSVSSKDAEVGDNTGDVECEKSGPDVKIAFNPRYLIELLAAMPEKVSFSIKGASFPIVAKSVDDTDYIAVLMPMHIQ